MINYHTISITYSYSHKYYKLHKPLIAFPFETLSHNKKYNYAQKVIRLSCVTYNNRLQPSQNCTSSCTLRFVYIVAWHTLLVLHINKYIISWRVNSEMWPYKLHVYMSSVVIKYFACYFISLQLTPAYDILSHNESQSYSSKGVILRKL